MYMKLIYTEGIMRLKFNWDLYNPVQEYNIKYICFIFYKTTSIHLPSTAEWEETTWVHPRIISGVRVTRSLSVCVCFVDRWLSFVLLFWTFCCFFFRWDFCLRTILDTSLLPVVCRKYHILFVIYYLHL